AADLALDDVRRTARHRAVGGDADQNLEQRADRASSAGAGKAAPGDKNRSPGQPDQSAFPVQYAGLDFVPHSHAARHRADADYETLRTAPPADAQHRSLRDPARGARID